MKVFWLGYGLQTVATCIVIATTFLIPLTPLLVASGLMILVLLCLVVVRSQIAKAGG
jgi:hypothetical protein